MGAALFGTALYYAALLELGSIDRDAQRLGLTTEFAPVTP
jgi:hypothetical protein